MDESGTVEVVVGRVGRAHGLRGDVVVEVRTDEPEERFAVGATVRLEGTGTDLKVCRTRWSGGTLIVGFEQVADRTAAEQLRGSILVADVEDDLEPDDPEEFWDRQLRGLRVIHPDGTEVGTVTDVVHLPAQDLLAVDVGGREHLVPFVRELVPEVDTTAGTVVVTDLPGLLDDRAEEIR